MKNTLEGINSRLNDTEDWIREVQGRVVEITATAGMQRTSPTSARPCLQGQGIENSKRKKKEWKEETRDLW